MSGIIAITNCSDDNESSLKIALWIFSSARVFSPAVCSTLQFFMAFVVKFMTLSDILYIFSHSIIQVYRTILLAFCSQSLPWLYFSASIWSPWGCDDLCIVGHLFLLFPCSILFILPEIVCGIQASKRSLL